jgi:hypothetical protein
MYVKADTNYENLKKVSKTERKCIWAPTNSLYEYIKKG